MHSSISLSEIFRPNLATAVAIGTLALGGLVAQAAENLEEVTVTAPTARNLAQDATGASIRQVTATSRVQYNPNMLTTNSGRALLNDKVADVARRLCAAVSTVTDPASRDESTCVRQAIDSAKSQLDAATARLKGK